MSELIDFSGNGNIDRVRQLLDSGADLNLQNDNGYTALINASLNGHTFMVELLLSSGADLNLQNINGYTALMTAENHGHPEIARILKHHMNIIRIQSIARGRLTRCNARTQKAQQKLSLMEGAYDDDSIFGKNMKFEGNIYEDISNYISRHQHNPGVSKRIREEEGKS